MTYEKKRDARIIHFYPVFPLLSFSWFFEGHPHKCNAFLYFFPIPDEMLSQKEKRGGEGEKREREYTSEKVFDVFTVWGDSDLKWGSLDDSPRNLRYFI